MRPVVFSLFLEARYLGLQTSAELDQLLHSFLQTQDSENERYPQFVDIVARMYEQGQHGHDDQKASALSLQSVHSLFQHVDTDTLHCFLTALWTSTIYRLVDDPQSWTSAFGELLLTLKVGGHSAVSRHVITQDDIMLMLLPVVRPGEVDSVNGLVKLAAKELTGMHGQRGCVSISGLVEYLVLSDIDSSSLRGTVFILNNLSSGLSFRSCVSEVLHNLSLVPAAADSLLSFILCNPKLQELKCGAAIDSNLTAQIASLYTTTMASCKGRDQEEEPSASQVSGQINVIIEQINILYLHNLDQFLQELNTGHESLQNQYLNVAVGDEPDSGFRWADLNIDELIMQADWVELPLGGKVC